MLTSNILLARFPKRGAERGWGSRGVIEVCVHSRLINS